MGDAHNAYYGRQKDSSRRIEHCDDITSNQNSIRIPGVSLARLQIYRFIEKKFKKKSIFSQIFYKFACLYRFNFYLLKVK